MTRHALTAAALFVVLAAACSKGTDTGTGGTHSASSHGEQVNGACPSSPQTLTGIKGVGEACQSYTECAPTCCSCSNGSAQVLAAACIDGACAAPTDTCTTVEDPFYCGGTGGAGGGGGSGGSGNAGGGGGTGGTLCVEGTGSSCYGSNMTWTGSECCVDGPVVCTGGTGSSCYGSNMTWTGKVCCVDGPVVCTGGTGSSCYGSNMTWTGSECCVDGPVVCVEGTGSSCYGSEMTWTGSQCCVDGSPVCTSGTSSSCYGSGMNWTGKLCCVG